MQVCSPAFAKFLWPDLSCVCRTLFKGAHPEECWSPHGALLIYLIKTSKFIKFLARWSSCGWVGGGGGGGCWQCGPTRDNSSFILAVKVKFWDGAAPGYLGAFFRLKLIMYGWATKLKSRAALTHTQGGSATLREAERREITPSLSFRFLTVVAVFWFRFFPMHCRVQSTSWFQRLRIVQKKCCLSSWAYQCRANCYFLAFGAQGELEMPFKQHTNCFWCWILFWPWVNFFRSANFNVRDNNLKVTNFHNNNFPSRKPLGQTMDPGGSWLLGQRLFDFEGR